MYSLPELPFNIPLDPEPLFPLLLPEDPEPLPLLEPLFPPLLPEDPEPLPLLEPLFPLLLPEDPEPLPLLEPLFPLLLPEDPEPVDPPLLDDPFPNEPESKEHFRPFPGNTEGAGIILPLNKFSDSLTNQDLANASLEDCSSH